ncbi:hypothetical protein SLA_2393 [Streptomyces laurentii]|uniref:Uncharacterized protein n=1 Tax=Streptomyces laurentii TaxID=39478 RepID=A0A160NZF9_STRLU|nr:hypothetical protein SLA_2393 [Streptomyces laurentii]
MSTTIPTPADVFRRQAHPLIAPGPHDPAADGPFRALYERGITGSRMIRNTKLVALTLASHADWATGRIPQDVQPYLAGLVQETALTTGQVVVSLQILEDRGWISRPSRRVRWDDAPIGLTIPAPILRRLRKAHRQD